MRLKTWISGILLICFVDSRGSAQVALTSSPATVTLTTNASATAAADGSVEAKGFSQNSTVRLVLPTLPAGTADTGSNITFPTAVNLQIRQTGSAQVTLEGTSVGRCSSNLNMRDCSVNFLPIETVGGVRTAYWDAEIQFAAPLFGSEPGLQLIRVRFRWRIGSGGACATQTGPDCPIQIAAVDLVQAVGPRAGEAPVRMVANKRTYVRVFVRSSPPTDNVAAVVRRSTDGTTWSAPRQAAQVAEEIPGAATANTVRATDSYNRDKLTDAINFSLPLDWITPGTVHFRVELTAPARAIDPANSTRDVQTIFYQQPGLRIAWVPSCYKYWFRKERCLAEGVIEKASQSGTFLREAFPVPDDGVVFDRLTIRPPKFSLGPNPFFEQERFLSSLKSAWNEHPEILKQYHQIVTYFPDAGGEEGDSDPPFAPYFGDGRIVLYQVKSTSGNRVAKSTAHEVGHNLGRRHTGLCGDNALFTSTDWPYPDGHIGAPGFRSITNLYRKGEFDIVESQAAELMSYCNDLPDYLPQGREFVAWISAFTFGKLFNEIAAVSAPKRTEAPARSAEAAEDILVTGWADRDGTAEVSPAFRMPHHEITRPSLDGGSHCLRFSGAGGALGDYCFAVAFSSLESGAALDRNYFAVRAPLPAGTTRVALMEGAKELTAMTAGSPISLSITSPAAGEEWTGGQARSIAWSASDPDGRPFVYSVSYSSDGGSTWLPLESRTNESQIDIDPAEIEGGNIRFRVMAAAGMDSAIAYTNPVRITQSPVLEVQDIIDFGPQPDGEIAVQQVTLGSSGNGPLRVTSIRVSNPDFVVTAPDLPLLIPAGGKRNISISWTQTKGDQNGVLTIVSNDSTGPAVRILTGRRGGSAKARAVTDRNSVSFGEVELGSSASAVVLVRNSGQAALNVSAATNLPFATAGLAAVSIQPGESQGIGVMFEPAGAGKADGLLTLLTNDPEQRVLSIALTGSGKGDPVVGPQLTVSPETLDFGVVTVGQSREMKVVLGNKGNAALLISGLRATGPYAVATPDPPFFVRTNTVEVIVVFTPAAGGAQPGSLVIASNDPARPSLVIALTGSGTGGGPATCLTTPAGLLSWWPGDGNPSDLSGGNNATLQGGATFGVGFVGQAFDLNGTSRYAQAGNPSNLRLNNSVTIEAWINPRSVRAQTAGPAMGAIVTKWAQVADDLADSDAYGLWIVQRTGAVNLFAAIHQAGPKEPTLEGGVIPLNTWTHVAMTFDGASGAFILYVNGLAVANANSPGLLFPTTHSVQIGREDSYIGRLFDGLLDEASVYGRALSAAEIRSIFASGALGKCKTAVTVPAPQVSATPAAVSFGNVVAGRTASQTVSIRNSGTASLTITSLSAPAPYAVESPATPQTLAPQGSLTVSLRFAPASVGTFPGTLTIGSNDPANPVLSVALSGAGTGPLCVTPPSGLVSWWPGDGNANDLISGYNGTLQGGATFAAGQAGQAFDLNGSTRYIQVGNPANLRLTNGVSIDAWVYPRSVRPQAAGPAMGAIVTKWAQVTGDVPASDGYGLWLIQGSGGLQLFSAIHQTNSREPNLQGGAIPVNAWSHVAMTFDAGGQYVLYINGRAAANLNAPGALYPSAHNVQIGREDSYIGRVFDGLIDEPGVYNRALTAVEIQALFEAGTAGRCRTR